MNILICDEMESDTEDLTHILDYSYHGAMKTVVFHRAADALSYVNTGAAVDVCFLETVTPEMNGIELARNLRAGGYKGEIVFVTKSNGYATECFSVKALDYLHKPIMPEAVRDAVRKAEDKLKRNRMAAYRPPPEPVPVPIPIGGNSLSGAIKRKVDYLLKRLFIN